MLKLDKGKIMQLIGTILIGFVVGLLARAVMPGRDPLGFILTALLGIGGALLGKYLGQALGIYHENDPVGLIGSLVGALILLFIYNQFVKRRAAP
jgi:uncharacterized membrane protein YeaQ/YmgE (transglycosylase-associated protein family)